MSGLIPLLLPSSASSPTDTNRRSLSPSSPPASPLFHRRQQSLPIFKSSRRASLAAPAAIHPIPFTSVEWKRAVDEVKRKYVNRKYRACSARCCEILDNLKDTSGVEPLYLIYLHFYAASSFELCARPLSTSSSYRTKLLRDARSHYNKTEALIQSAEESATQRTRSASSSSTASNLSSPALSPSNRSSTSSTTLSSPRTSVCSLEDEVSAKPSPRPKVKAKKKVSFSGLTDLIEFQPEPYIRPDSPTLGWEDDFFMRRPEKSPPSLAPKSTLQPSLKSKTVAEPEPEPEPEPEVVKSEVASSAEQQAPEEASPTEEKFDLDTFLQTRSVNRICAQLSALRSQVNWHREGIEVMLATSDDVPETPSLPAEVLSEVPTTPTYSTRPDTPTQRLTRANTLPADLGFPEPPSPSPSSSPVNMAAWRRRDSISSNSSTVFDLGGGSSGGFYSRPSSRASTVRSGGSGADDALRERIERLRAGGWQRKRFDSRRYEALRESVLTELGA
ncbi:hypothetical protein F5B20DRAFT_492197 [Whalleya microplaca]|nr:hypothetical protein F5B20DRAFT_492197 [Whalleya microplaca]